MSNLPIKDASNVTRKIDVFLRTESAETVETQAVAVVDPTTGYPLRPNVAGEMPVSGPVTDAQLRAAAVPVSGPVTDAQLRAAAVPVSLAAMPTTAWTEAMTDTVNERTTAYLKVAFRDKAGALAAPTAVSYRVDCLTTQQAVRASTSVSPASEVEITLTADDNAIRQAGNRAEMRRVTVVGTYGSNADQVTEQFDYSVLNLEFVT